MAAAFAEPADRYGIGGGECGTVFDWPVRDIEILQRYYSSATVVLAEGKLQHLPPIRRQAGRSQASKEQSFS